MVDELPWSSGRTFDEYIEDAKGKPCGVVALEQMQLLIVGTKEEKEKASLYIKAIRAGWIVIPPADKIDWTKQPDLKMEQEKIETDYLGVTRDIASGG